MITESLGLMLLGPAVSLLREATLRASWESGAIRMPKAVANPTATIARPANLVATPPAQPAIPKKQAAIVSSDSGYLDISILTKKPKVADDVGDWLTMRPKPLDALTEQAKQPWTPASSFGGGGGGAVPGAGGFATTKQGQITPLRVPPPSSAANSLPNVAFASSPSTPSPANADSAFRTAPSSSGGALSGGATATADPGLLTPTGGSNGAALGSFPYFPLYTLDNVDGTVLFPNNYQLATIGGIADLRAQAVGNVTFSWDTSHLTGVATNIQGTSTYKLTFNWTTYNSTAVDVSVGLTATDNLGHQETQSYWFHVPAGGSGGSGGGSSEPSWPAVLIPDTQLTGGPSFISQNVAASADAGSLETAVSLPGYNPNVPPVVLTYNSLAADPRPIAVVHHTLVPTNNVFPGEVSSDFNLNGTDQGGWWYSTGSLTNGDVMQIPLQANATGLSTGRYAYTATIVDDPSVPAGIATHTYYSTMTVLSPSEQPWAALGQGWSLSGLEKVDSISPGVIDELGGGDSLWFVSGGSGGYYYSPAGEFSSLASTSGGGWTRTTSDGTVYTFNSAGFETALSGPNGLIASYSYDGSSRLSAIKDRYNNVTTFSYDSNGKLAEITDPGLRITTFTHSGGDLTSATLPDTSSWTYTYDSSGRMTQVADPNNHATTIAYDSFERVGTITGADGTTQEVLDDQEQGAGGSSLFPSSSPTLLAATASAITDSLGHTNQIRPDWYGLGVPNQFTDPDGNVFDRRSQFRRPGDRGDRPPQPHHPSGLRSLSSKCERHEVDLPRPQHGTMAGRQ